MARLVIASYNGHRADLKGASENDISHVERQWLPNTLQARLKRWDNEKGSLPDSLVVYRECVVIERRYRHLLCFQT